MGVKLFTCAGSHVSNLKVLGHLESCVDVFVININEAVQKHKKILLNPVRTLLLYGFFTIISIDRNALEKSVSYVKKLLRKL